MEHKVSSAIRKHWKKMLPVIHWCGTCKNYTEYYLGVWREHCRAGKSYDFLRHCKGNCDSWLEREY